MKAIVQNNYGEPDILELKEVDRPAVKTGEVLVRVHASALNAGDVFSVRGSPWLARLFVGFPKPKDYILGWDLAGRVEAIGDGVTSFQPGDAAYATHSATFAEYASVPQDRLAPKPANLDFQQAAAVPSAGLTALQALRDVGKLKTGQKVLINGASGGVGTFAVQIAKALGADVTGVCSTRNVALVRSLGADHVVDYTKQDFTKGTWRYDLILDNVANHALADLRRVLTPDGVIVPNSGHGGMGYVFKAYAASAFLRRQRSPFQTRPNAQDLITLKGLIESGQVTPVIDRTYPLPETPEALRYVAKGHARGKVVLTIAQDGEKDM